MRRSRGLQLAGNHDIYRLIRDWHGHGHTFHLCMGRRTGTGFISGQNEFLHNIFYIYRAVLVTDYFEPNRVISRIKYSLPGYRNSLCFLSDSIAGLVSIKT